MKIAEVTMQRTAILTILSVCLLCYFATEFAEAVLADVFVNPENGPYSEDGSFCDPIPGTDGDFPIDIDRKFCSIMSCG